MAYSIDNALFRWREGQRRMRDAPPGRRRQLERVSERIVEELRRRLGGAFTTEELAALYEDGTDWCLAVAMAAAPGDPDAWDSDTVADAAFGRYVRDAVDFGGGRRVEA